MDHSTINLLASFTESRSQFHAAFLTQLLHVYFISRNTFIAANMRFKLDNVVREVVKKCMVRGDTLERCVSFACSSYI